MNDNSLDTGYELSLFVEKVSSAMLCQRSVCFALLQLQLFCLCFFAFLFAVARKFVEVLFARTVTIYFVRGFSLLIFLHLVMYFPLLQLPSF